MASGRIYRAGGRGPSEERVAAESSRPEGEGSLSSNAIDVSRKTQYSLNGINELEVLRNTEYFSLFIVLS